MHREVLDTGALGNAILHAQDAAGRPTRVTDPLGHVTETSYDALGRKSAVTDAAGSSTLYRYTSGIPSSDA